MLVGFLMSLLPILLLAFYNYPCADDFSASDSVRSAWVNSGSFIEVVKAALENVEYNYKNWSGVFVSVFWTSLQPGIFGERFYGLTTLITLVLFVSAGGYLSYVLNRKYLKTDRYAVGCVAILYLFSTIQCMPDGKEGLYWHAGVVNYTWAFAFLLLLLGAVLSIVKEEKRNKKMLQCVAACILTVLVGGGNFITALQGCLWMFVILVSACSWEWKKNGLKLSQIMKKELPLIAPALVLAISFGASVLAPGNAVRMDGSGGMGPVKAILVSFYYCLNDPIEEWLIWPIVAMLILAVPFMWVIVKELSFPFAHPGLVAIVAFCLVSAGFTPSLYAQGDVVAGRLQNTVYFLFVLALYGVIFYTLGWIRNCQVFLRKEKDAEVENGGMELSDRRNRLSATTVLFVGGVLFFLIGGSLLHIMIEENLYVGAEAFTTILSGQAEIYRQENEERLQLLKNTKENVVLKPFSNPPDLLLFQDITPNRDEWINTIMAEYYGKESVVREE